MVDRELHSDSVIHDIVPAARVETLVRKCSCTIQSQRQYIKAEDWGVGKLWVVKSYGESLFSISLSPTVLKLPRSEDPKFLLRQDLWLLETSSPPLYMR